MPRDAHLVRAAALRVTLCACGGPVKTEPVATSASTPAPETGQEGVKCPSWASLDPDSLPPLPASPHTATFEQVWRTVLQKHFDPTLACQDWPGLRAVYGEKLAQAKDAAAAYAVMNELLGTLKQSHFKVVAPGGAAETEPRGPARVPVHVRRIGGEPVVVDAAVGGVDSGVPRGAVLVAVDGEPVAEITAKFEDPSGFEAMRAIEEALHGAAGATRQVTFKDPTQRDAEVTRALTCVLPSGELVTIGNLRDIPTVVEHRKIGDVGYLAFNYWMLPLVQRVEAAMTGLRAAGVTGLVLDLRGNPGGVGAMSVPVARMLLTKPGSLGRLQFREFAQEFNVAGNPGAFTGPVAVLVDEGTASTSEIFAAGLRDLGRVQIFGSRASAGAALPSLIEALPGGGMLQYVVGDYHSSKGAVAEGDGVKPDVVVPETREDFVAGRDPVLDAAVRALSSGSDAAKVQP